MCSSDLVFEGILTFNEIINLLYRLCYVAKILSERADSARNRIVRIPRHFHGELLTSSEVTTLLDAADLDGFCGSRREYCTRFPLFTLKEDGDDSEFLGILHPSTGQKTVFVFTDEEQANEFAQQFGRGSVFKLADTPTAFKRALRYSETEVVAFDPVIFLKGS